VTEPTGKIVIITGGNSGIGKEAAVGIARTGAHVVIAARNPAKAAAAVTEIETRADARGRVETMPIDLASFASVREFAAAFSAKHDRVDVLLNNAGLVLHKRSVTVDGHETQFQVNHLSHFLLTQLLADALGNGAPARVINVSSYAHTRVKGGLNFDDLDWAQRRYRGFAVYSVHA
jgi:retinol dehydrogenase-12